MTTLTEQKLQQRLEQMPVAFASVVTSSDTAQSIQDISESLELSQEEAKTLRNYLYLLLCFYIPAEEFVDTVTAKTELSGPIVAEARNRLYEQLPDNFIEAQFILSDQLTGDVDLRELLQPLIPTDTAAVAMDAPTVNTAIKYQSKPTDSNAQPQETPTETEDSPTPAPSNTTPQPPQEETQTQPDSQTKTETAADPHSITPMHTMADDVDKIQGYGAYRDKFPAATDDDTPTHQSSSQEDILTPPKPKLADTPDVDTAE